MTGEPDRVTALVSAAMNGSEPAWRELVDRYASLVWSICRRYRLSEADAADVSQTVWLRAVEQLASLRQPAALPGWLATTARRECLKLAKAAGSTVPLDEAGARLEADEELTALDAELLAAERTAMIRECFTRLPVPCQRLLELLVDDTQGGYAGISSRLDLPIGSIGPTRARCLDKLRRCPAFAAWSGTAGPQHQGGEVRVRSVR